MSTTTVSAALIAAARERADELIVESHGLDGESAGSSVLDSDAELFVALAADLAQSERDLATQAATIKAARVKATSLSGTRGHWRGINYVEASQHAGDAILAILDYKPTTERSR